MTMTTAAARTVSRVAGLLLTLACVARADAAAFCVDTSAELRSALVTAENNGENDTIRIESGAYTPSDGTSAFSFFSFENFSLEVSGGWLTISSLNCLLQSHELGATVLNGANARRVMQLQGAGGTSGAITLSDVTLRGGNTTGDGGGLQIGGGAGFIGDVVVERVWFSDNYSATFGGGMIASADGGKLRIANSLFLGNSCGGTNCAASITVNATSATAIRAVFGQNTVVVNTCSPSAPSCDVSGVRYGGNARAAFFNNAFAYNGPTDADLRIQSSLLDLYNNQIINIVGLAPANQGGNIALLNPMFVNPFDDDYRLQPDSPLRNAGTGAYIYGPSDIEGNPRVNDGQLDIGAFENQDVLFADGFETLF